MAQQMPIVYISGNGTSGVYEGLILKWVCLISINIWRWCATLMELIKIMEIFIGTQTTLHRTPLNWLDAAHLFCCLLCSYMKHSTILKTDLTTCTPTIRPTEVSRISLYCSKIWLFFFFYFHSLTLELPYRYQFLDLYIVTQSTGRERSISKTTTGNYS